ncbi:MAG: sulfatase-like hydrolase/transferase [Gammaproteobacteria bacterium]
MRRLWLLIVISLLQIGCGGGGSSSDSAAQNTRPNILFIAVDDLRPDLGTYGFSYTGSQNNTLVKTPNIDGLAKSGFKFTSAYSQVAVCAASRNSVLSGLRPESTHRWDDKNQLYWVVNEENSPAKDNYTMATPKSFVPLPQHFQDNGYYTLGIGKVYHKPEVEDAAKQGWDVLLTTQNQGTAKPALRCKHSSLNLQVVPGNNKCAAGELKVRSITHAFDYDPAVPENVTSDQLATNSLIDHLDQFKTGSLGDRKNFFFAIGYKKPHAPFVTTTAKLNQYPLDDVSVPAALPPKLAASVGFTLWGEFQPYFYSRPDTLTSQALSDTDTVLPVQDITPFSVDQQIVIYDSFPDRTFRNIEHLKITSVDPVALTLTVQRGFLSSALPHDSGSVVATDKLLISYNESDPERILASSQTLTPEQDISSLPELHTDVASDLLPSSTHYGIADRVIDPVAHKKVIQDIRRHYWASTSMVDEEIGRLINYVENDPELNKNTIIVLWSDHGYYLGEYGDWAKQSNDELATRVPLIISTPASRLQEKNSTRPQLVELVDLYPTIVELAGIPAPLDKGDTEYLEGQSLVPLLADDADLLAWKQYAFSQFEVRAALNDREKQVRGTSVRSDKWRYTEWRQLTAGTDENGNPVRKINTNRKIIGQYGDELLITSSNPAAGLIASELYYEDEILAYRKDPGTAPVPQNYAHPLLLSTLPTDYPANALTIPSVIGKLRNKLKYAGNSGCVVGDFGCIRSLN